jgi:hypothetical protein
MRRWTQRGSDRRLGAEGLDGPAVAQAGAGGLNDGPQVKYRHCGPVPRGGRRHGVAWMRAVGTATTAGPRGWIPAAARATPRWDESGKPDPAMPGQGWWFYGRSSRF